MTATGNIAEFSHSFHIYNHCTDKSGLLRVKTLCDLLNDVAEMHTIFQHADVATLNKSGCTWMLRRIHLFMPDLPAQGADVTVTTWNPELSGLLVPRLYKVSDMESGGLHAFAHTEWMMVNLHTMRPERPTEQMKSIAGLSGESLPAEVPLLSRIEQKTGLKPDEGWTEVRRFNAGYADIDFNGHLTQSSYIQRMIDAHDFVFLERHRIKEMEVVYAHEIKPEAAFCVRYKHEGGMVSYAVLNEDQSLLHAWARARWE
ncbi:MAG: thioesterase [Bacteroides sp.]|nr:thioesterase [Bacteroides sp.]